MRQDGKCYLVGFMGAGKTVVGSHLAQLMGLEFVDLDHYVEEEAKKPVAEIFDELGEAGFRDLESASLASLAGRKENLVIATGGGTATRPENLELMRATGVTIWLDPPFEEILARLDTSSRRARPLFESPAQARKLYEGRHKEYSRSDFRVGIAAGEKAEEVAKRVLRNLSKAPAEPSTGFPGCG